MIAIFGTPGGYEWVLIILIVILPFWKICSKAGFSPWASLLMLVPFVNLIFLYYLAFAKWPIATRMKQE